MRRWIGGVALASLSWLVAYEALAAPPQAEPAATAGLAREVTPPLGELAALSQRSIGEMETLGAGIRDDLRAARAQRDVVKTLCLNDKLTQVDVAIRAARERRQSLELAVARSDADQAAHELTIISVLRHRVDAVRAEANQCIGTTDLVDEGETVTQPYVEPGLPEDPDGYPGGDVFIEPPSCSSCFK
jgi:hypothetical protein